MDNLPLYISIAFGLITLLTIWLFCEAASYSVPTVVILAIWLLVQSCISLTGFYTVATKPPRFALLAGPALILIALLLLTKRGRLYIDQLDTATLTLLHVVRLPVELVLLWLYLYKAMPRLMTFEGRNFDILSGISAPFVWYIGFVLRKINRKVLLAWNIICLCLLMNVVVNAVLSTPSPFQRLSFDQPNKAVLYFPYIWLPCCIVPLILLSHLAVIRQLVKGK